MNRRDVWTDGWRLFRYDPAASLFSLAMWSGYFAFPVAVALLLQRIFDRLDGPLDGQLLIALALFVGATIARTSLLYSAHVSWRSLWLKLTTLLHRNALASVVHSGAERGELPGSPGDATSRLYDDTRQVLFFLDVWLDLAGLVLFTVLSLITMSSVSPIATLVVLVPMAVVAVVNRAVVPYVRRFREADREATAELQGFIGELFGGVLAVKVGRAERAMVQRVSDLADRRAKAALRDRALTDALDTFTWSTVDVSLGLVLISVVVLGDTISVGDLALFTTLIGRLTQLPRMLGRLGFRAEQARVSMARLDELTTTRASGSITYHAPTYMDAHVPIPVRPAPVAELECMQVRGLTYRYPAGGGIEDVSFEVPHHGFVVVTGPLGGGKSTLLRALAGLLPPQDGQLIWNGEIVTDPAAFLVPPRAAYLPQNPRLFSEPLFDNLSMSLTTDPEELDRAVELAALVPDLAAMPDGLRTTIGPRGVRLSGGQIQRAAAARAFLRRPRLLLIDDLSSALDTTTERELWDRLTAIDDVACLLISSRRTALERATQILVVEDGSITARGTLAEVMASSAYVRGVFDDAA